MKVSFIKLRDLHGGVADWIDTLDLVILRFQWATNRSFYDSSYRVFFRNNLNEYVYIHTIRVPNSSVKNGYLPYVRAFI